MFPQIFGKYVLEREMASGGMARVYLATLRGAKGFEKRLVVKQIRPELSLDEAFVRRFVAEAKTAVELSHPNIVPVYELGVELGIYYLSMELCEGLTLSELLEEGGPLGAAEGAYLGVEVCRALDYAHRRAGIVHRDVTPRNVMLDDEGAVRLIDFGIAAPVSELASRRRAEIFGSPGHMPPEQLRGERLTPATDVFALAALLMEAWTGMPPFRRADLEASVAAMQAEPPRLSAAVPLLEPLSDIVRQSLALSAAERPQDAETLGRRLRDYLRQFDSGEVARRLGARVGRARRRKARELESEDAAAPEHTESPRTAPMAGQRLTSLSALGPVTRTFAASEAWTRKIASVPPPPADERDSDSPPAMTPSHSVPHTPREARGVLTPARFKAAVPRSPLPRPAAALAALAVLVASFVWLERPRSAGVAAATLPPPTVSRFVAAAPARSGSAPIATFAPAAAPSALAAPLTPPRPLPAKSAPMPQQGLPRRVAPAASIAASAAAPARAEAVLRLSADPPARVTIAGPSRTETRTTPVRALRLPPGVYSVSFRSETYGAPVATRVELREGDELRVHADFRAAEPAVAVY